MRRPRIERDVPDPAVAPPELPDVWQGPVPEERRQMSSDLADVYEGPEPGAEFSKRVDIPPTEVGAAMAEISEAVRRSRAPDDSEAQESDENQVPLLRVERDEQARDELSRPDVTLIHHVVVPGATIAMVGSLLFFLLDVRAAFVGGSFSLKWMGLCFVVATVLIARYIRLVGRPDSATLYSSALAVVTFVAMAMSPWEPPQTQIWGPLFNGVVLYITWRFASRLMHDLSADLDETTRRRRRLFGLERQALETVRRQQAADVKASYRRPVYSNRDRTTSDSEAALRSIARLTWTGLVIFALGEPILRLAEPGLGGKALGAMVAFLIAAGVLLAAASVAAQQRRLQRLHASAPWTLVTGRVATALLMTVLALAVVLQFPAVHVEGTGHLDPDVRHGRSGALGDEPGREPGPHEPEAEVSESAEEGSGGRSSRSESGQGSESGGDTSNRSAPASMSLGLVSSLAGLGAFLRWPLLALVAIFLVVAAVRWIGRQNRPGSALLDLCRNVLGRMAATVAGLWNRIGGLVFRRRRTTAGTNREGGDPFAAMGDLRQLDPRPAVVGAYAVLQAAFAKVGHTRSAEATPMEYFRAIPGVLDRLRPAAGIITRLYLLAAYAPTRLGHAQRRQALEALDELRAAMQLHAEDSRRR